MELFAVSQPGLEEATYLEFQELGLKGTKSKGGVTFSGDHREIYLTNLWLRSANRVLLRLCSFRAKHFAELVRKAAKCKWKNYLKPGVPVKVRVTSRRSKLYHTKAIEERIYRAIEQALGAPVERAKFEEEGTSVIVRFDRDACTISLNTSGAPLHKRGYRVVETEAPLRENLAAAAILLSGWRGEVPFVDPFCGSGTIPIEAALIASHYPPGAKRRFAFQEWPTFNRQLWEELLNRALSSAKVPSVPILGFDIDPDAVSAAQKNASAAGVDRFVQFKNLSFPDLYFEKGVVVTNPPYGVRLPKSNVVAIYRRLGEWFERSFGQGELYFLSPSLSLAEEVGLQVEAVTSFSNGGIRVTLYRATK